MAQNLVIPNKDNKVVFTFAGVDLTLATDISVVFGAETYTLLLNPTVVIVDSATQMSLDLSATSEVGQKYVTVTYFDSGSVNGTDITSQELNNLGRIIVAIGTQLIIEDGTIIANANSFASDDEFKTYADLRGLDIPATQPEREALLIKAMDYLVSIEGKLQGSRVSETQELIFPRNSVYINNFALSNTSIPNELKRAQIEAAYSANTIGLLPSASTKNVSKEKVDTLEVEYFSGGSFASLRLDNVNAQLKKLFKNSTGRLVRI